LLKKVYKTEKKN